MKYTTLLLATIFILITACSNDDDTVVYDPLVGNWSLVKVNGGFNPLNIDYQEGDVYWEFDENVTTLTVVNNILNFGPENIYSWLPTGNYAVEIDDSTNPRELVIEDNTGLMISFDGEYLILSHEHLDGNRYTFYK